ncbi:MAG: hypothetical protein ACXAC5_04130 [Promethearchaeota archaeon]
MGFWTIFVAGQISACMILATLDALIWKRGLWVYILSLGVGFGISGLILNALS